MDSVGGMVGIANFISKEDKLATIYLIFEDNLGNRLMVTSMQAFQEGQLLAKGKAVYNFIKSKSWNLNIWNIF